MDTIIANLTTALTTLLGIIDWVYVLVFFMTAYMACRILGDTNILKNIAVKMQKRWVVLISAVVLAIIFGIFYKVNGGFPWFQAGVISYTLAIFLSFLMGLFLNEFTGIEYLLDKLFKVEFNKKDYKKGISKSTETPIK